MIGCEETRASLTYRSHQFNPEDLLHFIEATAFTSAWDEIGLNAEDDLLSVQLCIMAHPQGDREIDGSNGLRFHCHHFGEWSSLPNRTIGVYYAYFEDFGIVYLACLDPLDEEIKFTNSQLNEIANSIGEARREIERLQSFH